MATWAKGLDFKNSGNTARIGGVGMYGTDTTSEKIYIGFGTEPWNNSGLQITKSGINYKGNKVYHAGDKPSLSDLGAAASNHSHSYLPLSGGNLTGKISNNYTTNTYLAGNQGNALVNTTSTAGSYVMLYRYPSTNGYFTTGGYQGKYLLQYTNKATVDAGTNAVTKAVTLLDESGNSQFPGVVSASSFSGALSGNATTATTLQTARTINGTSFNGSANITTANWGTARTLTIGNSGKSVNGSGNISWSLSEIGAASSNHVHSNHIEVKKFNPGSSTEGRKYMRLLTIQGTGNVDKEFTGILSGTGDYGHHTRGTYYLQFAVRADTLGAVIKALSVANSDPTEFFYKKIATSHYEIWAKIADYNMGHTLTTLSNTGADIHCDSFTTTAPASLSAISVGVLYSTTNKPTPADIGALPVGSWSVSGQDLLVHRKRALVGMSNGSLYLGYGGDFTNIRCGNDWVIWHSNNFNPDSKLGAAHKNSYWGMAQPNGDDTNWIRTTSSGIIPYSSNGAGGYGQGSLGTISWRFKDVFANTGDFNGRVLTDNITARGASLDIYATNNSPHYESNFTVYQGLPGNGLMRFRVDNSNVTSYRDFRTDRIRGGANGADNVYIGAGNFRIEATSNSHARLYTSPVGATDTGLYMDPGGYWGFKLNSVYKHQFNNNGTKYGGSIEIEGTTYGMSPIDSPQVLIEDVIFDMNLINEETVINLNDIFAKSIDKYAVFPSNKNIEIIAKNKTSFTVRGIGLCDFRIVGTRIDSKDKYYEIMGGFIHGTEEAVTI